MDGWGRVIDFILWSTEVFSINPILEKEIQHQDPNRSKEIQNKEEKEEENKEKGGEGKEKDKEKGKGEGEELLGREGGEREKIPEEEWLKDRKKQQQQRKVNLTTTRELNEIFDILYKISTCNLKQQSMNEENVPPPELNRIVVNIVIDLINSDIRNTQYASRVRYKLNHEYPELQLFILAFLINIIHRCKSVVNLCNRFRFWDALFSDSFYYCGLSMNTSILQPTLHIQPPIPTQSPIQSPPASPLEEEEGTQLPKSSPDVMVRLEGAEGTHTIIGEVNGEDRSYQVSSLWKAMSMSNEMKTKNKSRREIFSYLHKQVVGFLKFAGGLVNFNNKSECMKLMQVIEYFYYDYEQIEIVFSIFDDLLQSQNKIITQQVLTKLNPLPIFNSIIKEQYLLSYMIQSWSPWDYTYMSFSKDKFISSRMLSIQVLKKLLKKNEELKQGILKDQSMMESLFQLLYEITLRDSVLQLISDLMIITTSITQNKQQKHSQYKDYELIYTLFIKQLRISQSSSFNILPSSFLPPSSSISTPSLPTASSTSTTDVPFSNDKPVNSEKQRNQEEINRVNNEEREKEDYFNLLLRLLQEIRVITQRSAPSLRLFRETGTFLNITTVLNVEEKKERLPELCIEVVKTIHSLLMNSDKNKKYLSENIGYDQLIKLILRGLDCDIDKKLLHHLNKLLLDLLVDGEYNRTEKYVISNSDIILFIFKLILYLPNKQRNEIFDEFIYLVDKCPLNQTLCCEKELIFYLLEIIPSSNRDEDLLQRIFSLIELLGTHRINVKELKKQFLLLKTLPGDFRPPGQIRLLKALQFMALSRSYGPLTFFNFNGKTSSLEISQPLEKWPKFNGYTFCFWLRVESIFPYFHQTIPSSSSSSSSQSLPSTPSHATSVSRRFKSQPRIISFMDQDGYGLEVCISSAKDTENNAKLSSFVIEVLIRNTNGEWIKSKFKKCPFHTQKWYFITITHFNFRKLRLKDPEIKLIVNGEQKVKQPLKYPQFPNQLNRLRIGSNFAITKPSLNPSTGGSSAAGGVKSLVKSHYLHGQLGSFLLFDGSITNAQSKFIYEKSTVELIRKGTSCLLELEKQIQLYFNCTARVGKKYLDLTPEKNRDNRQRPYDATAKGKINNCITPDVKDIIHCLGGIQVLFPIFAQLDQPEQPLFDPSIIQNHEINYSIDKRLILQSLALLGDMLHKSETNQIQMLRSHGFPVIGFLLEQLSPVHFTSETIVTLEDLANKINPVLYNNPMNNLTLSSAGGPSSSTAGGATTNLNAPSNPSLGPSGNQGWTTTQLDQLKLYESFWQNIFFNWSIWKFTGANVIFELVQFIYQKVQLDSPFFRRIIGVQSILDSLYYYFWYNKEESTPPSSPVSASQTDELIPMEEEKEKDEKPVNSVEEGGNERIINVPNHKNSTGLQGIEAQYHPVTNELIGNRANNGELKKIRNYLFAIMKSMVQHGIQGEECKAILSSIIEMEDELQQIELMQFLFKLIKERVPLVMESIRSQGGMHFFIYLLKNNKNNHSEEIKLWIILLISFFVDTANEISFQYHLLENIGECTLRIYQLLFNLLLNVREIEQVPLGEENQFIKKIVYFPIILEFIEKKMDIFIKQRALQDIYLLLSTSSLNRDEFLQLPNWAFWLFKIIITTTIQLNQIYFSSSSPFPQSQAAAPSSPAPSTKDDHQHQAGGGENSEPLSPEEEFLLKLKQEKMEKEANLKIINDLSYNILRLLIIHLLTTNKNACKIINQQIITFSIYFESENKLNREQFLRNLFVKILNTLKSSATTTSLLGSNPLLSNQIHSSSQSSSSSFKKKKNNKNQAKKENENTTTIQKQINYNSPVFIFNLLELLGLIEEFLFYSPRPHEIYQIQYTSLTLSSSSMQSTSSSSSTSSNSSTSSSQSTQIHQTLLSSSFQPSASSLLPKSEIKVNSNIKLARAVSLNANDAASSSGWMASQASTEKLYQFNHPYISYMIMHNSNYKWDDLEFARLLFDTLYSIGFFQAPMAQQIDQIIKETNNQIQLRTSMQQILLRIAIQIIRDGDISNYIEIIPRIRDILQFDLITQTGSGHFSSNPSSSSQQQHQQGSTTLSSTPPSISFSQLSKTSIKNQSRIIYVISSLLPLLKNSLINKEINKKMNMIASLVKDLLPFCLSNFPQQNLLVELKKFYQEDANNTSKFIEICKSPHINMIISWTAQQQSIIDQDEKQYANFIDKKHHQYSQSIKQFVEFDEHHRMKVSNRSTESEYKKIQMEILMKEIQRKKDYLKSKEKSNQFIKRVWRNILRSLTNERGPWATTEDNKIYWKLDNTENFSRMKLKLKQNYKFDAHQGAAKEIKQSSSSEDAPNELEINPVANTSIPIISSGIKLAAMLDNEENEEFELLLEDTDANEGQGGTGTSSQSSSNLHDDNTKQIQEKVIFSCYCEYITPLLVTIGSIELTNIHLSFTQDPSNAPFPTQIGNQGKDFKLPLSEIKELHLRRCMLRRSAIEIFKIDRKTIFLNFKKKERNKIYQKIISLKPVNLTYYETGTPEQIFSKNIEIIKKWQNRQISNFDYLMWLNTIAGRSYNDIRQYPVFPWILTNYSTPDIDLHDETNYRDLSKPIGALSEKRLNEILMRYNQVVDPNIPNFHYGSHYSNSGFTLFYLVRMEPFTTYFLQLQGGHFDHPDRMFDSIEKCWKNVLISSSDVKELIPEFFYLPEFLLNQNHFYFGFYFFFFKFLFFNFLFVK